MNDIIDRFVGQVGIPFNLRPAIRDAMRTIADIARRNEQRELVTRLATCPPGTLVSDVSLSLAHGLTPQSQAVAECVLVNSDAVASISEGA